MDADHIVLYENDMFRSDLRNELSHVLERWIVVRTIETPGVIDKDDMARAERVHQHKADLGQYRRFRGGARRHAARVVCIEPKQRGLAEVREQPRQNCRRVSGMNSHTRTASESPPRHLREIRVDFHRIDAVEEGQLSA